jgi:hypothetical protein
MTTLSRDYRKTLPPQSSPAASTELHWHRGRYT